MEFLAGHWNKDWTSFFQFWLTVILSLQMQFSPGASCPEECRCDKSFVYCNERSLTSVPLGMQEGFKVLYLHNNQINNAGFPMELHNLASVETVYLYGNQLDEFPINLPKNTRVLHLQENNIQTISRGALAQLTRLEELHLDDNSISTVGVEEGAFREALNLKLLFLTKNHLSSVPIGLPEDLKELRLDENRIAVIAEEAFQNVTHLQRLLLDGNLLTDEGIAPGTFQELANLRELALARNSLTFPPPLLPSQSLVKLSLQENQIDQIPVAAFANLNRLERLDVSSNQLQTLTQGVFDSLSSLKHLIVRNNPWRCDCAVKWVVVWLKSLPSSINARGFVCQSPDKVRGMAIRELTLDIIECPVDADQPSWPTLRSTPPPPPTTTPLTTMISTLVTTSIPDYLDTPSPPLPPIYNNPPGPLPPYEDPLQISFHVANSSSIEVSWASYFTVTAYKVTWVKRGQSQINEGMQERTVSGGQRHISLTNLEPRSVYRICVHVLDTHNSYRPGEDTICSEARTKSALTTKSPGSGQNPKESVNSTLLMAGIIGGAVLIILVTLLSLFCWHMHRKSRSSSTKWKYNRGRRKDDYCEAGTKKDNSILEMTETSFQIVALNNEQLLKGDFRIQPIYTPNGGIGFRDCHLSNNSLAYCKSSNVPSTEFCHT
ncbi:leucine-rich repeat transmembrane protein FLRT2 [Syngnathoides biaculeatus]|uniref:leucine-rich repeat transmembrane protein FLRT2 n=1 Tax=Syngnathoides biaculeatus TaxID=300417 RepID=UPI002ADDE072|nr:leucine-rich repeat transmembrane protein FLRT2 [Syngnathoides biaculeatus]XP_061668700.1 leucine-rich repeat transmembrane protein FLRT2 [Syngnathoides biaculeatus]XP_061668701.1 leucine-rich repeat transmembrane protein FLRT2 [Syngnathoides biaculeatus]XP_061668702.1 leucine-rich repeat transmembrane protein FLRT2 [Syngnathoides biaculeatus]XP_061668703.1 leucine-rich repeat transmembrane protein FLRT2 [Syngnathoides biaculeatus]XP_061668704.1 leucine-rich repeat transmembrane protein FLR